MIAVSEQDLKALDEYIDVLEGKQPLPQIVVEELDALDEFIAAMEAQLKEATSC